MSRLDDYIFGGGESKTEVEEFLEKQGFEWDSGPRGEGYMRYVASGRLYAGWISLCKDHLSVYIEYDFGGHINDGDFHFHPDNFDSFMDAYQDAIEFVKGYVNPDPVESDDEDEDEDW
jgi:hypothetical protein